MTTQKEQNRIILTVLTLSTLTMSMSATTPALADIAAAFPDARSTTVALLATIPPLFSVPCSLITGRVVGKRFKYRQMSLLGVLIILVAGLLPYVLNSLPLIVATRALMGVGLGILAPITPAITLNCLDKATAESQMGRNGAMSNIAAIVFQLIGGYACAISWRYCFLAYLLVVPVFVIVLINMREPEMRFAAPQEGKPKESFWQAIRAFGPAYWVWMVLFFCFVTLFYAYITNIARIIAHNHYGTALTTALVLCVFSVGGAVGGQLLSRVVGRMQQNIFIFAGVICFVGKLVISYGDNIFMMFLGSLIYGVGWGVLQPAFSLFGGLAVAPERRSFALAVIALSSGLATFLSAYIFAAIASACGNTWDRFPVLLSAFGYLLFTVGFGLRALLKRKAPARTA